MSLEFVRKLPTPTEIREQYPLSARATEIKKQRDAEIAKVFTGDSDKFLVIVGPCSADNEDAVLEYNHRLAKVADKVSDKLIIIPRVYTNKPRTTGEGYKGIVHQPDPEGKPDLLHGLIAMRKMHMRVVEETDLTSADEMLYPSNWSYLSDILSYVAVGARSVENQEHRLTVSGIDIPAGMKNPTSGDLSVMINSVIAAQLPLLYLPYLGGKDKRKSAGAHHSPRCDQQARQLRAELSLRGHSASAGEIQRNTSRKPGYHHRCQPFQLRKEIRAADPYRQRRSAHKTMQQGYRKSRKRCYDRKLSGAWQSENRMRNPCLRKIHYRPVSWMGSDRTTDLRYC